MRETRKIRVMEIVPSCQRGGVPTVVYNLISNLEEKKFEVHLVAPDDGPLHDRFARLCPVYDIPIRGCYPLSVCSLRRLIRAKDIDIIHAHGKGAGLYGRIASLGTSARRVYTLHGFNYDHYSPLFGCGYITVEKMLARITDRIVTVSDGEKQKAERAGLLSKRNSIVIANGIALNGKDPCPKKGHVLGTLSRTCRAKGLEFLIESIALLKDKYPGMVCYIAGGTPKGEETYEVILRKLVRDLHIEDRIVFLGEISDIEDFFSKINVYVSTSRWEGLPTAVLEAFAAKTPVIATDVVGNSDLVKDRQTGILVKAEDSKAVAAGIEHAFEDQDGLATLAANAFRYVSENFSVGSMVSKHEALYESLLAR